MAERTTGLGRHLKTLIKLLFVAGLMWFVLSQTPWQDRYEVRSPDGTVMVRVEGRIVGPWDVPEVRFVPDGKQEITLRDGAKEGNSTVHILPSLQTYWRHLDIALFLAGALCYLLAATFAVTRWLTFFFFKRRPAFQGAAACSSRAFLGLSLVVRACAFAMLPTLKKHVPLRARPAPPHGNINAKW